MYKQGRGNSGSLRKVQLHKGNEGKPEPKPKGGWNSTAWKITRALTDIYDNNLKGVTLIGQTTVIWLYFYVYISHN